MTNFTITLKFLSWCWCKKAEGIVLYKYYVLTLHLGSTNCYLFSDTQISPWLIGKSFPALVHHHYILTYPSGGQAFLITTHKMVGSTEHSSYIGQQLGECKKLALNCHGNESCSFFHCVERVALTLSFLFSYLLIGLFWSCLPEVRLPDVKSWSFGKMFCPLIFLMYKIKVVSMVLM